MKDSDTSLGQPAELSAASTVRFGELVNRVATRQADFPDLIQALSPFISTGQDLPADTALQLSLALHDIEDQAKKEDQLYALVEGHTTPALAVNSSGQILASNIPALNFFSLQIGDSLSKLGVSQADFQACKARIAQLQAPSLLKLQLAQSTEQELPLIAIVSYHQPYRAFVISALQQHWPQAMDRALEQLFGLSESERQVLAALARGCTAEQIAADRQRSLGTIRQQIKAILHKLSAGSQVQAASMASAAASAISKTELPSDPLQLQRRASLLQTGDLLRDGRLIGWRRFGDPKGSKVLMLHGPFFGAGDFPLERQWAERLGFDVYALERPGYGRTQPAAKGEDILNTTVADAIALLEQQSISQLQLLSHEVGLVPALALANQRPELVSSILGVSAAPPFNELRQVHAMPAQQRIFIWAAQNNPWLVRLLIRLGMVRFRKLGPSQWHQAVFGEIAHDSRVLQSPEHQDGVVGTYSMNVQQTGAGFISDLQLVLSDWANLVTQAQVPVCLLHGQSNQTTKAEFLQIFRNLNPEWQVHLRPDQGQTLAVADSAWVYQQLAMQRLNHGK